MWDSPEPRKALDEYRGFNRGRERTVSYNNKLCAPQVKRGNSSNKSSPVKDVDLNVSTPLTERGIVWALFPNEMRSA